LKSELGLTNCYGCHDTTTFEVSSPETKAYCAGCSALYPRTIINDSCYLCSSLHNVSVPTTAEQEGCLRCEGKEVFEKMCLNKCSYGSFRAGEGLTSCYGCSTSAIIGVASDEKKAACLACPDANKRAVVGDECHSCSYMNGVALSSASDRANCTACPDRMVITDSCYKSCPAGSQFKSERGLTNCYSCIDNTPLEVTSVETKASCKSCAAPRTVIGDLCYLCDTLNNVAVVDADKKAACLACDGREVLDDTCYKKCAYEQFRSSSAMTSCFACNTATPIPSATPGARASCLSCTASKRTIINNTCYSCEALNNVAVSSAADIASCLACPDREVVDGMCMKKCASGQFRGDIITQCFACSAGNVTLTKDYAIAACLACGNRTYDAGTQICKLK
jgi:hypothetical protein